MNNVKLSNRRAGTVKLPGGKRLKKGRSIIVPLSMLSHKSVRKLISAGRMQVSSLAKKIEAKTDGAISSARDAVDDLIDHPLIEEASDKVLDAVETAVEEVVDSAIEAVSDAAESALDAVSDFLGLDDSEKEAEEAPKPKRRGRRKKTEQ